MYLKKKWKKKKWIHALYFQKKRPDWLQFVVRRKAAIWPNQLVVEAPPPPPQALKGWHLTAVKLNWQHCLIQCQWPQISIHCGKQGFSQKSEPGRGVLKHFHQKMPPTRSSSLSKLWGGRMKERGMLVWMLIYSQTDSLHQCLALQAILQPNFT